MQTCNDIHKLYEEFGDKICLDVWPEKFDPTDERAAVQAARDYVDFFCKKGKPAMLGYNSGEALRNPIFTEELYTYSRKHYLNQ